MRKKTEVPVIFFDPDSASEIIKIMTANSISLFPNFPPLVVNNENTTDNTNSKPIVVAIDR